MKSPEVLDFICWMIKKPSLVASTPSEYETMGNFMEVSENILVTGKNTIYEQIVESAGIDRHGNSILSKFFL